MQNGNFAIEQIFCAGTYFIEERKLKSFQAI